MEKKTRICDKCGTEIEDVLYRLTIENKLKSGFTDKIILCIDLCRDCTNKIIKNLQRSIRK